MYVNLMSQLNGVLAVSTWCRWCGLAPCVCIARPVINYSSSIRFCHWHIHVIHCNACSRDQGWPSREPRASCASARAASPFWRAGCSGRFRIRSERLPNRTGQCFLVFLFKEKHFQKILGRILKRNSNTILICWFLQICFKFFLKNL